MYPHPRPVNVGLKGLPFTRFFLAAGVALSLAAGACAPPKPAAPADPFAGTWRGDWTDDTGSSAQPVTAEVAPLPDGSGLYEGKIYRDGGGDREATDPLAIVEGTPKPGGGGLLLHTSERCANRYIRQWFAEISADGAEISCRVLGEGSGGALFRRAAE
ncbi:MAG: hypothetical protein R3F11_17650 [Verrucomicrobiales bacterium]